MRLGGCRIVLRAHGYSVNRACELLLRKAQFVFFTFLLTHVDQSLHDTITPNLINLMLNRHKVNQVAEEEA